MSDTIKEVEEPTSIKITGDFEGIPYRGVPINLKKTDKPEDFMKLNTVLYVKRFELSDEKQLKEYEEVCQKIQDGHAQQSYEKMEYIPDEKHWVALVRWIDYWYSPLGEPEK